MPFPIFLTILTEEFRDGIFVPFVKESRIQLGVEFKEKVDFTINGTICPVGEIGHVYFPGEYLQPDGFVDIEAAQIITCIGLDNYHITHRLSCLSYPKPDKWPENIEREEQ